MSAAEEFTAWLRANLPDGWMDAADAGDDKRLSAVQAAADEAALIRLIGEAGWGQPQWAPEHGGRGLSGGDVAAVEDLKDRYRLPRSFNLLGFGLAAPTIMQWGSEEQKRFFLPRMAAGDWWCQLFSEPGNGSDVAGLSTRAVRDGDEWVVDGQKVWTSGAHISKWGMLVARTDPDQPKHRGITYFVVDMHSPGVEVRPLRQMTGDAEFNEVFLTGVRVPDDWRIGPEGGGWAVAQTTLMNERVALSGAFGPQGGRGRRPGSPGVARVTPADLLGAGDDGPVTRDRLVSLYVQGRAAAFNGQRAMAQRKAGQPPGPEGSVGKLFGTEYNQRLQRAAIDAAGAAGVAWEAGDDRAALRARGFLRSRGNTIEGGTSEIQRNILGDRVLGLPREPDASRDLPWKDVPRN